MISYWHRYIMSNQKQLTWNYMVLTAWYIYIYYLQWFILYCTIICNYSKELLPIRKSPLKLSWSSNSYYNILTACRHTTKKPQYNCSKEKKTKPRFSKAPSNKHGGLMNGNTMVSQALKQYRPVAKEKYPNINKLHKEE